MHIYQKQVSSNLKNSQKPTILISSNFTPPKPTKMNHNPNFSEDKPTKKSNLYKYELTKIHSYQEGNRTNNNKLLFWYH